MAPERRSPGAEPGGGARHVAAPLALLRALVALLPRRPRAEYADELVEVARRRRERLEAGGRRPGRARRMRFWMREWAAALVAVALAWCDTVRATVGRTEPGHRERERTMKGMWTDVTAAMRSLRRRPGLPAVVAGGLAAGLGATLAIVTLIDGVLLRPVTVPDADRVVRVFQALNERTPLMRTAYPTLMDYRAAADGLEGPAGFMALDVGIRAGEVTDRVSAGVVTGDYFDVVRIGAAVGRALTPADDRAEAPAVVVLGHGLWLRVFGGDAGVVGRTLEIGGTPFEIVGVAERGFTGVSLDEAPELWIPLSRVRDAAVEGLFTTTDLFETRAFAWLAMVGRLEPGVEPGEVAERLDAVAHGLRAELGDRSGVPADLREIVRVEPALSSAVTGGRDALVRFLALLAGVVTLTLVVACANAAHLLTARSWSRAREFGVRQALGAGRTRIARQLLAESVLIALVAGALGVGLAVAGLRALGEFALPGGIALARLALDIDGRLLAAALAMSLLTAVAFGLGPALLSSRGDVAAGLRTGGRGATRGGRGAQVLIALQVGFSVVLVVGALLFTRTLGAALSTDLGFEPDGLAAVSLAFRGHGYADAEVADAVARLVDGLNGRAEIGAAALATHVPLSPGPMRLPAIPEGAERSPGGLNVNIVTPGYRETLGLRLVEGRDLTPTDVEGSPDVALVTRAAAELFWPGEPALGRTFVLMRGLDPVTVVGVVDDHHAHAIDEPRTAYAFMPLAQNAGLAANRVHVVSRGAGQETDARVVLAALRAELARFDPGLPVHDARLVDEQLGRVMMPQRFGLSLLGLLSGVTVVVTAIGVYAMVTFGVRRRTRELGIRMALGAGPGRVVATTVAGAAAAAAVGIALGLAAAAGLGRLVEGYLYGVTTLDAASYLGGAAVLLLGVAAAAALPARRAVALDPTTAVADDG